ncbi:MAG: M15 family metallopeptidase [Eubacterium sp.]|nr:M15 family metallopeptidase [Eubacterium sp.]
MKATRQELSDKSQLDINHVTEQGEKCHDNMGALVRVLDVDSDFIIDLRYAGENNFTGRKIYSSGECYIDINTLKMLVKARDIFRRDGYRVKIWDAYRPISAQKHFWEIMPDDNFVARPPDMSKLTKFNPSHMNGQCVDITLTDLDGKEIQMPTLFDDFGPLASLKNNDENSEGFKNAAYLRKVMEEAGFSAYEGEWWHFYDRKSKPAKYLDFQI